MVGSLLLCSLLQCIELLTHHSDIVPNVCLGVRTRTKISYEGVDMNRLLKDIMSPRSLMTSPSEVGVFTKVSSTLSLFEGGYHDLLMRDVCITPSKSSVARAAAEFTHDCDGNSHDNIDSSSTPALARARYIPATITHSSLIFPHILAAEEGMGPACIRVQILESRRIQARRSFVCAGHVAGECPKRSSYPLPCRRR